LLIQNEARRGAELPQHPRYPDMNTSYSKFLATNPPLFSGEKTRLRQTIGSALPSQSSAYFTVQSIKRLCMQLRGPAGAWWASYIAAHPADHHVPWDEFRTAFCGHHLLAGTMRCKLAEFLDLHQGNRSVYEYIQEFNNLAQYGSHNVDTNAMKVELFRKGLTIQL
jgi:hypothetical protein